MKAIAVKNDEFKTVGLEVKEGNTTIFSWGISPAGFGWVKSVTTDNIGDDVFNLIRIKSEIAIREKFAREFFDVCSENNILLPKNGVNFKSIDENIKTLKRRTIAIIEKFK